MHNFTRLNRYWFLGMLSFQTIAAELPDALDASIRSSVPHQPVVLSEKPAAVAVGNWKSLNSQVHQRGGWQAYATQAGGHNHDSMEHSKHQQMDHSKHQGKTQEQSEHNNATHH